MPVCALDAHSLARLAQASVAAWRSAGRLSEGKQVQVDDGSASFFATEIEDRSFKIDGRAAR